MSPALSRRSVVGAALALGAGERASAAPVALQDPPPLKSAPFPVGTCVQAFQLDDPALSSLIAAQVSQLTEIVSRVRPDLDPDNEFIAR